MVNGLQLLLGLLGAGIVLKAFESREHKEVKNAHDGEYRKGVLTQLRDAIDDKFNRSDLEEVNVKMSGQTVDLLPSTLDQSFDYSEVFAGTKATTYVNDAPFGGGVTDVQISANNPYTFNLSSEDFKVSSLAVGQEGIAAPIKPLAEQEPTSTAVSFLSFTSLGEMLSNLKVTPSEENPQSNNAFSRAGTVLMNDDKTFSGTYLPNDNDSYTDGSSKTQTLAEWRGQGLISKLSDNIVEFIPRTGGSIRHLRRI